MIDKLNDLDNEFTALEQSLGEPDLLADPGRYRQAMKRYAELKPVAELFRVYRETLAQIAGVHELAADPEMGELAKEELAELEPRREDLEQKLERLLVPRDPFDDKSVIVEIRAAAGGDEASLFAAELLSMYIRYAESLGFKAEVLDSHPTEVGGLSKVSLEVNGAGAYSRL
jgi:peptide chain release factor 1